MRRSIVILLASLCQVASVPALVAQGVNASPSPRREWRLRMVLDSAEVQVEVTSHAASVTVVARSGTFVQAFATSGPLADWAQAGALLPAPVMAPAMAAGSPSQPTHVSATLAPGRDTAARFDLTEFTLTRVSADSADSADNSKAFMLNGTNGAWTFAFPLSATQASVLFATLEGLSVPGALPYDLGRIGRTVEESSPGVSGAYVSLYEVDRPAELSTRPPAARYPPALRGTGIGGSVRLAFIVDSTGSVLPASVRLLGKAHPLLAQSARVALLRFRFRPARIGRSPVAYYLNQEFIFVAP